MVLAVIDAGSSAATRTVAVRAARQRMVRVWRRRRHHCCCCAASDGGVPGSGRADERLVWPLAAWQRWQRALPASCDGVLQVGRSSARPMRRRMLRGMREPMVLAALLLRRCPARSWPSQGFACGALPGLATRYRSGTRGQRIELWRASGTWDADHSHCLLTSLWRRGDARLPHCAKQR